MKFPLVLILICLSIAMSAQKVGVVLSGGGAAGSAHIGVLKALEENNIPIDYISGTSIGALVGGFYAAGYSPQQIENLITTAEFRDAANGIVDEQYEFYLNKSEENAGILSLNFNLDSILATNLPTNFVSANPIDFGLMSYFSTANAAAKGNFDSLMIPFRCLAANITQHKQTILKSGNLATAIRASMTYPFYLQPITIDGDLMLDGGLLNNFPSDVLCAEFEPDFIIASKVTSNPEPPTADNVISQIKNILQKESKYDLECAEGVIINTNVEDISTFDFFEVEEAIQRGYNTALLFVDSIGRKLKQETKRESIIDRRHDFNLKKPDLIFDKIQLTGLHQNYERYFKRSLKSDSSRFTLKKLTPRYFKLATNEKIKSIYPIATFDSISMDFNLSLNVVKEKPFKASFGGVIATKPFSTAFFEFDYQVLGSTGLKASGNIYFGNFYSSVESRLRWDVPFDIPFYLESQFTINRFDFFNGRSTFIEEDDPPYIITSEQYWESKIVLPAFTKGKLGLGASLFWQDLEYYQNEGFQRGDTADLTEFNGFTTFVTYSRNSLNRKMYASSGSKFDLNFKFINGTEITDPGSLSATKEIFKDDQDWLIINSSYEKYFFKRGLFRIGTYMEATYSDQPNFQNYTATLLNAPAFIPLPESKTLFQEQYRAKSFGAIGLKTIFTFRDQIDFRLEGYLFQPYEEFLRDDDNTVELGGEIETRDFIGTFTTVYHTRLGPLAMNINYFDNSEDKFSFLLHFGYVIFNKKVFE